MQKVSRRRFLVWSAAGLGLAALPGLAGRVTGERGVETDDPREPSLWSQEIPAIAEAPVFAGDISVDLAIVGAGYTGLACAFYVKTFRPEWKVAVLESHRVGSGASSRNSGAVYARYRGGAPAGLADRGLARLERFIDEQHIDCNFRRARAIEVFSSKWMAERALGHHEGRARRISEGELAEHAGTSYYRYALELSDYYSVHPAKLVAGHAAAARRAGVEIYERSPVVSIEGHRPFRLRTPRGSVSARRVFVATNAYTPRLGLFARQMMPVHQYSVATRRLTPDEIERFGLDRWDMRFEPHVLPVTCALTPSGHFFARIVLGYASFNSCTW
ncbi:MAG: FAD-binding oxidoreductase, partial [Deltaproteobacteria bacterium]